MNTNDDATKKIDSVSSPGEAQAGEAKGTSRTSRTAKNESRTAQVADGITSRISAIKNAGENKAASRTSRTASAGAAASGPSSAQRAPQSANRGPKPASDAPRTPGRRVRLTLSRLDPWSVMKFSFLVAVCFGLTTVIATALIWQVVDSIGLWDQLTKIGTDLNNGTPLPFMEYFEFTKMLSYATIVSVLNVVIITALGTLFAFLYNIVAALLGGIKMTFTDD